MAEGPRSGFGPLPHTRDACLTALGLDPSAPVKHDARDVSAAYRRCLFRYHPDSGGSTACPDALNRIIHAHNVLSGRPGWGWG